ncbi:quinone oxidoreductase [Agrobacterium tumefaciens]|uniref:quinone oxidoreductase family protein n=1 Tax=Agrobacterium tumefaciens TaxID=358 RepID=UPI0012B6BD30|nr:zinc-binding dehydrogenase [Agrobacterium tumefaciens]MQB07311.1 quinone oxidoreductase [Agrobacterium tumefaciens]
MKAIVVTESGPALRDVPVPTIGPAGVLVRVHAAALNRADLSIAAGQAHGSQGGIGTVVGLEWAGVVEAVGTDVTEVAPGDRVMASGEGGYAEYAATDYGRVSRLPDDQLDLTEAATLPVALQTMHDAIVSNGRLHRGEAVLIQGASSGVGLMGLQIAREMGARLVIGTSTDPTRRAQLADFGANISLDSSDPSWPDTVLAATDGAGVELIVDQVAGPIMNANLRAAAILGRIVNVGRLGGREASFDFDLHALRRIHYIGVTFRTRNVDEVRDINRRMRADLWAALQAGRLRLPLAAEYPLTDAADALAHMRANKHFGKIVLRP